jgi:hypothetical protein
MPESSSLHPSENEKKVGLNKENGGFASDKEKK